MSGNNKISLTDEIMLAARGVEPYATERAGMVAQLMDNLMPAAPAKPQGRFHRTIAYTKSVLGLDPR